MKFINFLITFTTESGAADCAIWRAFDRASARVQAQRFLDQYATKYTVSDVQPATKSDCEAWLSLGEMSDL